jgi:hypothetical protein
MTDHLILKVVAGVLIGQLLYDVGKDLLLRLWYWSPTKRDK